MLQAGVVVCVCATRSADALWRSNTVLHYESELILEFAETSCIHGESTKAREASRIP